MCFLLTPRPASSRSGHVLPFISTADVEWTWLAPATIVCQVVNGGALCCTLQQGGWVLVETILDNSMVEQLSKMIYFQDWRHAMSYTLPEVGTAS